MIRYVQTRSGRGTIIDHRGSTHRRESQSRVAGFEHEQFVAMGHAGGGHDVLRDQHSLLNCVRAFGQARFENHCANVGQLSKLELKTTSSDCTS